MAIYERECCFGVAGVRAQASGGGEAEVKVELRTCRSCKKMFNPLENHPRACRFHTAHYGGQCTHLSPSINLVSPCKVV